MRIAIIQFPGSNCEAESIRAIKQAGMEPVEFLWNGDYGELAKCDGYFIVGGFSYEDRSRAGIIASLDPVMKIIERESLKGKPVLGICNGAQILVETGLVPGLKHNQVGMALAVNKRVQNGHVLGTGFYNTWTHVQLAVPNDANAFTRHMQPEEYIKIPVAHAEGRFVIPDELLDEIKKNNLTLFRYADDKGNISDEFPTNPNGATYNLAAVGNIAGNIMAMMPHPERCDDGQSIFTSMREYILEKNKICIESSGKKLEYSPTPPAIENFQPKKNSIELMTELIITDNEAGTVQNALNSLGIKVEISRQTHWEIDTTDNFDNETLQNKIVESGELFNSNKERIVKKNMEDPNTASLLIRYRDDFVGKNKKETLQHRFGIVGIDNIKKGIIWNIKVSDGNIEDTLLDVLNSRILFNQYSQITYLFKKEMGDNSMKYEDIIRRNIKNCLTETNLNLGEKHIGKVRDRYELEDEVILITTDRQSAFDRVLASIPFKGQVLNQTSAWWFEKTKHIVPNHVIDIPDPNVTIGKKTTVFPVEFVVRGYITGSTGTSAWVNYQNGVRNFCGNDLPEGLRKNQKLDSPIITPTTKFEAHDRNVSPKEIIEEGLMNESDLLYVMDRALELFIFGQETAQKHGLILVDTKYEFGKDAEGNVILIDEIHTPDSSRYWTSDTYEEKFARGEEPENIDKEFLRLWFKNNCDPYNDPELPPAPDHLVIELSRRYIQLYEMITGQTFIFPEENTSMTERMAGNLQKFKTLQKTKCLGVTTKAILLLGSAKDEQHAKKITDALGEYGISWEQHIASAHKDAKRGLEIIEKYKDDSVVYITIAGRSNALSGFVAGNSNKPVIACPPFEDKLDLLVNIQSTLQMPSNVPAMTILEPGNVALAIRRIIKLTQNN